MNARDVTIGYALGHNDSLDDNGKKSYLQTNSISKGIERINLRDAAIGYLLGYNVISDDSEFIFEVEIVEADKRIGISQSQLYIPRLDSAPLMINDPDLLDFPLANQSANVANGSIIAMPDGNIEYTDLPVHDIAHGKYSKNLILPDNPQVVVDWGDGTTTVTDEAPTFALTVKIDDETSIVVNRFIGYGGDDTPYMWTKTIKDPETGEYVTISGGGHTYKEPGTYTVKIRGFYPSFALPECTTKIINWGDVGLKAIPSNFIQYCSSTLTDFGTPKYLDNVVAASLTFYDTINTELLIDFSFLHAMKNLMSLNLTLYKFKNYIFPSDFLKGHPLLSSLSLSDCNIIDDNTASYCPNLRYAHIGYSSNTTSMTPIIIGNDVLRGCSKLYSIKPVSSVASVGDNFLRDCVSLATVKDLFNSDSTRPKLEHIGEGFLRGCPYIRDASGLFSQYASSPEQLPPLKIPDKLFYDLKVNPNLIRNRIDINNFMYRQIYPYVTYAEAKNSQITLGTDMFCDEFFESGGEIVANNSSFGNYTYVSTQVSSDPNDSIAYVTETYNMYNGPVYHFWKYPDKMFANLTATVPIDMDSFGYSSYGYFGYERGHYLSDGVYATDYYYYNDITNYDEIPQPIHEFIETDYGGYWTITNQFWLRGVNNN